MSNLEAILKFIGENNVLWMILIAFAMYLVGRSVPPETIDKLKADAAKTDTPVDDAFASILDMLNGMKATPINSAPQLPDIPTLKNAAVQMPKGIPINRNWKLQDIGANGKPFYDANELPNINTLGRAYAVPHGYLPVLKPEKIGDKLSVVPDAFHGVDGVEFALAYKRGFFGWSFDLSGFVLAGASRYALIMAYDAAVHPLVGTDGNATVYLKGLLRFGGREVELPAQAPVDGTGEAQWIIRTRGEIQSMTVEAGFYMPWASIGDKSTLTIMSIKFVPTEDNYGGNAVIDI